MIQSVKRKNIPHLADMNDYEFVYWLYNIVDKWKPRVHIKLDGFFGRFGRDPEGNFFFQTARSDVLYDPKEVIWHALKNDYHGEQLVRAKHICEMFTKIQNSINDMMPPDTVYECEFFYKPLSQIEGDKITFVTIPYDLKNFPTDLTIYIHKASKCDGRGEFTCPAIEVEKDGITYRSSMLHTWFIDMTQYRNYMREMSQDEILSLRSLKHRDREMKRKVREEIANVKEHLIRYLLSHDKIRKPDMGEIYEGLVVHINTKQFKVVTREYRRLRDATL